MKGPSLFPSQLCPQFSNIFSISLCFSDNRWRYAVLSEKKGRWLDVSTQFLEKTSAHNKLAICLSIYKEIVMATCRIVLCNLSSMYRVYLHSITTLSAFSLRKLTPAFENVDCGRGRRINNLDVQIKRQRLNVIKTILCACVPTILKTKYVTMPPNSKM
jgi:hypothetical protein